jgi:hypothetical protein
VRPDFELQPTLFRIARRAAPVARRRFDALFRAASDPLIWEQHPEPDRYTAPVFQRYFDGAMASKAPLPSSSAPPGG